MISFRFHLVSVVAIFLALAVGIVVGSTVIDQGIVDTLENRVEDVRANLRVREEANDELRAQVDDLESFIVGSGAFAVDGRLEDTVAVVVADRGVDNDPIDQTIDRLDQAGAAVRGVLTVQSSWDLEDEERRASLAEVLGVPEDEAPEVMQEQAAALLVADVASSVEIVDDDTGALDAIAELRLVGFEVMDDVVAEGPEQVLFVIVTGPTSDVTAVSHVADFASAAVDSAGAVVAAEVFAEREDGPDRADSLAPILGDPDLAAEVATVDDLDLPMGPTTAVLALAAAREGEVGHFGVGDSADRSAPLPPGSS